MLKRKSFVILFLAVLIAQVVVIQPSISSTTYNSESAPSIQSAVQPDIDFMTANTVGGTENIKANLLEDGGCEEDKVNGEPEGFWGWTSGYNTANFSYQDDVHAGTYGGYLSSRGTEQYATSLSRNRYFLYIPERSYLDQKITMDLWCNAKANPDFAFGTEIFIYLRFTTDLGNYYLFYYLSRTSGMPSNSSTQAYIDVRGTIGNWRNIVRNVTEDFEQAFSGGPDLSQSYMRYFYMYCTSRANPIGATVLLVDDVSFTNDTGFNYFSDNGDFEDGDSNRWSDYNTGPGTVYLTDDTYTQGTSAMNISTYCPTSYSDSYASAETYYFDGWQSIPKTYYAGKPGDFVINFDWQYSDIAGLGSQRAEFYMSVMNQTYSANFYFILGNENDDLAPYSNYSASTYLGAYIAADNFGSRDTWNHFSLDIYTLLAEYNLTNLSPYYLGFNVANNYVEDGTTQLLVDDVQIIAYPAGDPSFEGNFPYNPSDPITYWRTNYDPNYGNITNDAHTGNYAANLSSYGAYTTVFCRKSTFLPIVDNLFTDFWWRLDEMTPAGGMAFSEINLRIDDTRLIHYILGNNSLYTAVNTSVNNFIFVEDHNQIGTWNNLFRNITDDVIAAFGSGDWNITEIDLSCHAQGTSKATTIFDDIHFVRDIEEPLFHDLVTNPTIPEYSEDVQVTVDVTDNIQLDSVELFYKIDAGSWVPVEMTNTPTGYIETIPGNDYGTVISYYIEAEDIYGHSSTLGTPSAPMTYTVADNTDPILDIDAPPTNEDVNSTLTFTINEASDVGSGIANFQVFINGTSHYDDSIIPATIQWETAELENGLYPILFRLTDNAGNINEVVYEYNVYYPPTWWESFVSFMQEWGVYIGAGAGALLVGILTIVIVVKVKRKKKLAA